MFFSREADDSSTYLIADIKLWIDGIGGHIENMIIDCKVIYHKRWILLWFWLVAGGVRTPENCVSFLPYYFSFFYYFSHSEKAFFPLGKAFMSLEKRTTSWAPTLVLPIISAHATTRLHFFIISYWVYVMFCFKI